jgi:hypothetical protein
MRYWENLPNERSPNVHRDSKVTFYSNVCKQKKLKPRARERNTVEERVMPHHCGCHATGATSLNTLSLFYGEFFLGIFPSVW